jgi:hypothetical protein
MNSAALAARSNDHSYYFFLFFLVVLFFTDRIHVTSCCYFSGLLNEMLMRQLKRYHNRKPFAQAYKDSGRTLDLFCLVAKGAVARTC